MRSRARSRRKNRALRPQAAGQRAQRRSAETAKHIEPRIAVDAEISSVDTPTERVTRPDLGAALAQSAPTERADATEDAGPESLSLSGEFFTERSDSFPPLVEDTSDGVDVEPPSAELVARRSRLRRVVGGFVGVVAAACAVAMVIGTAGSSPLAQAASAAPPVVTEEEASDERVEKDGIEQVAAATAHADDDEATEETAKDEAEETPEEDAAKESDPIALRRDALRLLNMGRYDDAIAAADVAIAADPEDALPYLCKGSALADKGDQAGARSAYSDCVREAKRGAVYECAALGGRK